MRAINLGMRLGALAAKLGLVLSLAVFLPASEVATFGLVTSVIVLGVYSVGLDFYTYANRELSRAEPGARGSIIRTQWSLYLVAYVALTAVAGILVASTEFPAWLIAWIVPLIVVEHQAQEVNRILVTIDDQLAASAIMFVRSGLWGLLSMALFVFFEDARHVNVVFVAWLTCSLAAVILGVARLHRRGALVGFRGRSVMSVRRGLIVALPFFVGTLAINLTFTVDRFLVGVLVSADALAAYTVFITLAGALRSILDAGVFAFSLPQMLKTGRTADASALQGLLRRVSWETAAICGGALLLSVIPGMWLVAAILGPVYVENFWMLPLSVMGMGLFCLTTPPQQVLYARDRDMPILVSNLLGLTAFVAVALGFAPITSLCVPIGLVVGMSIALVIKAAFAARELARGRAA